MHGKKSVSQRRLRQSVANTDEPDQKRTPYTRYYQREPTAIKEPHPRRAWGNLFSRLLNVSIGAILIFSAAYSLIDRSVSVGKLSQGSLHTKNEYSKSLADASRGINYRLKPLFDQSSVTKKMQADYPEITDVAYDIPWLGSHIVVGITTASSALRLVSQNNEFIIDETGRAVTRLNDVNKSTVLKLPKIEDQTGYEPKLGQQVLTKQQTGFITTVVNQLVSKSLAPSSIILPSKAQELDVRITGLAYYIKFYMGGDGLVQSGAFLATKQKLDKQGPQPADYIDVRIEDRVFVK